jgi:hypothetical protein
MKSNRTISNQVMRGLSRGILIGALLVLAHRQCHGQTVQFAWQAGTNQLAGSGFTLFESGGGSLVNSKSWTCPTNGAVLTAGQIGAGTGHFVVTQVSTNAQGMAFTAPPSGEVQVVVVPSVAVTPYVMSSTDLGQSFTPYAEGSVIVFPTAEAQRFFYAKSITPTNQIVIPPTP